MSNPWDGLADSVIGLIKSRASKVWEDNAAARDLITDAAKDLAKLTWQYKLESDPAKQQEIQHEMEFAKQAIENELDALAIIATAEAKALFKEIVNTALNVLVTVLPKVLAAI
jgi:hypothetical protein